MGIRTIVHDTSYQLEFVVIIAICQIDIETSSSKMEEIQQPADGFLDVIERLEENYENHVDTSKEEGPFIVNEDMRKLYVK